MCQISAGNLTNSICFWDKMDTTLNDAQYKPEKYQSKQKYKKWIKIQCPSNGNEYRDKTKIWVSPLVPHVEESPKTQKMAIKGFPSHVFPCVPLYGKLGSRLFKYHVEKILGVKSISKCAINCTSG